MTVSQSVGIQVRGLSKRKIAALAARAKRLGMTPQGYVRHLVEEDLAISEQAKTSTFRELLGPGKAEEEAEIDRLVDAARTRYHQR